MTGRLIDRHGRQVSSLRISVTDRCNFRCRYCMPDRGLVWLDRREILTYEEIHRLVNIFAQLGVTNIRLTGGEPLMRRELHLLVEKIHSVPGVHDIALTTNGYFLAEQALALVRAGLKRINVSVDSVDPAVFAKMVRRDYFRRVWEGLEVLENLPIRPIKINVVLIRGVNDREIASFVHLARTKPFVVRFIEFIPIGAEDGWSMDKVVPTREVIERINALGVRLMPVEYHGDQPADRYKFEDGLGEIGFISSVSEPFCSHCNRVRLTSDGKLRTCLFSLHETDLKSPLRSGATDDEIAEVIIEAVWNKEEGHLINRPGFVRPERTMSQIGG
jgi:cyclic pyranopterin phosphate synthase